MPVSKVCECCGKSFNTPLRRSESVRFCSLDCKTASGRERLSCSCCGNVFERVRSELRGKDTYCSKACYLKSMKGKKHPANPLRPRYFKTCETCKQEFRVTETRKDTARFCSRACQSMSTEFKKECSEKQQAEKHWRWTGGKYLTHEGYIRNKRKVFGKEGFVYNHRKVLLDAMLAECPDHPFIEWVDGKPGLSQEIDVHHIDRNRSNNELSNLLAVTKAAHAQIHHRNTKPHPWECWPSNPASW